MEQLSFDNLPEPTNPDPKRLTTCMCCGRWMREFYQREYCEYCENCNGNCQPFQGPRIDEIRPGGEYVIEHGKVDYRVDK